MSDAIEVTVRIDADSLKKTLLPVLLFVGMVGIGAGAVQLTADQIDLSGGDILQLSDINPTSGDSLTLGGDLDLDSNTLKGIGSTMCGAEKVIMGDGNCEAVSSTLSDTLSDGNSAGSNDIDMNGQDVLNINWLSGDSGPIDFSNDIDMEGDDIRLNGGNIRLNGGYLSNDGDNEGISVDGSGNVDISNDLDMTNGRIGNSRQDQELGWRYLGDPECGSDTNYAHRRFRFMKWVGGGDDEVKAQYRIHMTADDNHHYVGEYAITVTRHRNQDEWDGVSKTHISGHPTMLEVMMNDKEIWVRPRGKWGSLQWKVRISNQGSAKDGDVEYLGKSRCDDPPNMDHSTWKNFYWDSDDNNFHLLPSTNGGGDLYLDEQLRMEGSGNIKMGGNNIDNLPDPPYNPTSDGATLASDQPITKDYFRAFGWGDETDYGDTGLYHVAVAIPDARVINSPENGMPICSPLTDDNEPGQYGATNEYQANFIIGYSTDNNGHCLRDISDWSGDNACVSLLVAGWADKSHEGFGAWCRDGGGGVAWAQASFTSGSWFGSYTSSSSGLSKPSLGSVSCSDNGLACVKRVR